MCSKPSWRIIYLRRQDPHYNGVYWANSAGGGLPPTTAWSPSQRAIVRLSLSNSDDPCVCIFLRERINFHSYIKTTDGQWAINFFPELMSWCIHNMSGLGVHYTARLWCLIKCNQKVHCVLIPLGEITCANRSWRESKKNLYWMTEIRQNEKVSSYSI